MDSKVMNSKDMDAYSRDDFDSNFEFLTGHKPFPWQRTLYNEFIEKRFRNSCGIPTGLGKTATIGIWRLALAHHARADTLIDFPRRLVYVVNRRTVVDQATREVEKMRDALANRPELLVVADALRSLAVRPSNSPLAISTLRGQFADNAEGRDDPTRPAVISGTIDMIGSRLLFSGYGRGFKTRPLHAAFLGQDTLLIHDEAHLEPAFQELIIAIESEQKRSHDFRPLKIMEMTATSRFDESSKKPVFTKNDRNHPVAKKRINARKGIVFCPINEKKKIADEVARLALEHKDSNQAILIFLRTLNDVKKVIKKLPKRAVEALTGTLRGLERDKLTKENPIFARFMPMPEVEPKPGTVYLVCTSAGEVGVNISADHLVCDLTPFDSMAQRFGRVNRFGDGDARIDIVHSTADNDKTESKKKQTPFDKAIKKTFSLLQQLPKNNEQRYNASPAALNSLPADDRHDAFTPQPVILPASDILFDAWALTSIRKRIPGRPPVADWLHGIAEWDPPQTHVAWRKEVGLIIGGLREKYKPEDMLEDYPLKPHELLRDRSDRVFKEINELAKNHPEEHVWLLVSNQPVQPTTLGELVNKRKEALYDSTILLPPEVGGLKDGLLNGKASFTSKGQTLYDVADEWKDEHDCLRRCRIWDDTPPLNGMRRIRTIDTQPGAEDELDGDKNLDHRYWHWYARPRSADDVGSRTANFKQDLESHLGSAECFASKLVAKLGLCNHEASAVKFAAKFHDLGKDRRVWQRSIQNEMYADGVVLPSPMARCCPPFFPTSATSLGH